MPLLHITQIEQKSVLQNINWPDHISLGIFHSGMDVNVDTHFSDESMFQLHRSPR